MTTYAQNLEYALLVRAFRHGPGWSRGTQGRLFVLLLGVLLSVACGVPSSPSRLAEAAPPVEVLRIPHRVPSAGLAWSKAQYPGQYADTNMARSRLRGLDDRENERFLDVANRAYSRAFVTGFSYSDPKLARPVVDITYCRKAETFTGLLQASGLKPNFVYQMKLCGDYAADPIAFERIGRLGRWRKLGSRSTNFTDAEVVGVPDRSAFESYVFFDFFITDENGDAEKEFYLDSTLHVLYNQNYQGSPKWTDSRPVTIRFANPESTIYSNPKTSVSPQYVYAQTEAGFNGQLRPDIGNAFLPPGTYQARLTLVEETFHGYGYGDSGYWPTVMECSVSFDISDRPPVRPMHSQASSLQETPVSFLDFLPVGLNISEANSDHCKIGPDGGGKAPSLILTNGVTLVPGQRHIASLEVRTDGRQPLYVYVGAYKGMKNAARYCIPASDHSFWQPVELEITPEVPEVQSFLTFVLSTEAFPVELRRLRIRTLSGAPASQ